MDFHFATSTTTTIIIIYCVVYTCMCAHVCMWALVCA